MAATTPSVKAEDNVIADIFKKLTYGPAPESDSVVKVRFDGLFMNVDMSCLHHLFARQQHLAYFFGTSEDRGAARQTDGRSPPPSPHPCFSGVSPECANFDPIFSE